MIEFTVIYIIVAIIWAGIWAFLSYMEWDDYRPDEENLKFRLKMLFCAPIWFVPALLMLWKLFAYTFNINLTRKDEDVQVD